MRQFVNSSVIRSLISLLSLHSPCLQEGVLMLPTLVEWYLRVRPYHLHQNVPVRKKNTLS